MPDGKDPIPTIDSPPSAPPAQKPPPWARSLLAGGAVRMSCRPIRHAPDDLDSARAILRRHGFQSWRLEGGGVAPPVEARGAVSLTDPFDTAFEDDAVWALSGGLVLFGWRIDTRKPPATTMATELARRIAEWRKEHGQDDPPRYVRSALQSEVTEELRKKMIPARKVIPTLWHPADGWIILSDAAALEAFRKDLREALSPEPVPFGRALPFEHREALGALHTPTRLRRGILPCEAPSEAGDRLPSAAAIRDFMLWLAVAGLMGEGVTDDGGQWEVSGGAEVVATLPHGAEVSAKMSRCEIAALPAALAEDGVIGAVRLAVVLADGRGEAILSISCKEPKGLVIGWTLPDDPEGEPADLQDVVWGRLAALRSCEAQLQVMLESFAQIRTSTEAWADFVLSGREWMTKQLQTRIGFDPSMDSQVGEGGDSQNWEAGSAASGGAALPAALAEEVRRSARRLEREFGGKIEVTVGGGR